MDRSARWKRLLGLAAAGTLLPVAVFLAAPAMILTSPGQARYDAHQELVYEALARRVTRGCRTEQEKALSIVGAVHSHLIPPRAGTPGADYAPAILIRGYGYCDHQANVVVVLARHVGIRGRVLHLRGYDSQSHHSVCELYIGGKYRVLDPMTGYIFFTPSGEIATFDDLAHRPETLDSWQFDAVLSFDKRFDPRSYFRLYEPKYSPEIAEIDDGATWQTPIVERLMRLHYSLWGDRFLAWFQDEFFRRVFDGPEFALVRARYKQLAGRREAAVADLDQIIAHSNDPLARCDAMYFKARALWDMHRNWECIEELRRLLEEYPGTKWLTAVEFYLGDCYENLRSLPEAARWYSLIRADNTTPAPGRLLRLEKLLRWNRSS